MARKTSYARCSEAFRRASRLFRARIPIQKQTVQKSR